MRELLCGCGYSRNKLLDISGEGWHDLTTLDINPLTNPDILHDLNVIPWPFDDATFDEIHIYEVLEHLGSQGDVKSFFDSFREMHRILKDGGHVFGTTPSFQSPWCWGDPGHTRVISTESLQFLRAKHYESCENTPSSDYRALLGDMNFTIISSQILKLTHVFVLRKEPAPSF